MRSDKRSRKQRRNRFLFWPRHGPRHGPRRLRRNIRTEKRGQKLYSIFEMGYESAGGKVKCAAIDRINSNEKFNKKWNEMKKFGRAPPLTFMSAKTNVNEDQCVDNFRDKPRRTITGETRPDRRQPWNAIAFCSAHRNTWPPSVKWATRNGNPTTIETDPPAIPLLMVYTAKPYIFIWLLFVLCVDSSSFEL